MNPSNPYHPPSAAVSDMPVAVEAATDRKRLVPLWIKIFGWIFMLMGAAIPVVGVVAIAMGQPASFEIFGLQYRGSPLHPMALFIMAIIMSLAVSAYGLLFGKSWGVQACLVTGYGGAAISLATMVYSVAFQGTISIRLELLLQVPYLMKLHKIKPLWLSASRRAKGIAADNPS